MKLSISPGNSKTGKIPSVSLPPGITCTKEACRSCFVEGCYAAKLARIYPNVKSAWGNNLELWQTSPADYFRQLDVYLAAKQPRFFRFHISGDFPNRDYFTRSLKLALKHPAVKFLAFTKRLEFVSTGTPANITLVYSCWPGNDIPGNGTPCAYLSNDPQCPTDARICPGNCESCGMCWSLKRGESVCFDKH